MSSAKPATAPRISTVAVVGTGVIGRSWAQVFARAGCGFERLCQPRRIGDVLTVAGLCETAAAVTDEIRARNHLSGSIFADPKWMTSLPIAA